MSLSAPPLSNLFRNRAVARYRFLSHMCNHGVAPEWAGNVAWRHPVLNRRMVFPVSSERLWEALVAPSEWMGAEVEWELVPGGDASFRQGEDGDRRGQVLEVAPGRRLSFRWWPEHDPEEESEVTFDLEPGAGG